MLKLKKSTCLIGFSLITITLGWYLLRKKRATKIALILTRIIDLKKLENEIDSQFFVMQYQDNNVSIKDFFIEKFGLFFKGDVLPKWNEFRKNIDVFVLVEKATSTQTEIDKFLTRNSYNSENVLYVSLNQIKGRGRGNNKWEGIEGNVFMTLGFILDRRMDPLHMSILSGLVVHKVLNRVFPREGLTIKWPNDIYFFDYKIGGIYTECVNSITQPENINYKIGIGLNLKDNREFKGILTLMNIENFENLREHLIIDIVNELFAFLRELDSEDLGEVLERYLSTHLYQLNKKFLIHDLASGTMTNLTITGFDPKTFYLIGSDNSDMKFSIYCDSDHLQNLGQAHLKKISV